MAALENTYALLNPAAAKNCTIFRLTNLMSKLSTLIRAQSVLDDAAKNMENNLAQKSKLTTLYSYCFIMVRFPCLLYHDLGVRDARGKPVFLGAESGQLSTPDRSSCSNGQTDHSVSGFAEHWN